MWVMIRDVDQRLVGDVLFQLHVLLQRHVGALVELVVHGRAERGVDDALGYRLARQLEVAAHRLVDGPLAVELAQQPGEDLAVARLALVLLLEPLLDRVDAQPLLHRPRQALLVGGGEQRHLADLAQVHPHRVVDADGLVDDAPRLLDGRAGATPRVGVDAHGDAVLGQLRDDRGEPVTARLGLGNGGEHVFRGDLA